MKNVAICVHEVDGRVGGARLILMHHMACAMSMLVFGGTQDREMHGLTDNRLHMALKAILFQN